MQARPRGLKASCFQQRFNHSTIEEKKPFNLNLFLFLELAPLSHYTLGSALKEPLDAVIVLGYAIEKDGTTPTPPLRARVRRGVQLFCRGAARHIIFSG